MLALGTRVYQGPGCQGPRVANTICAWGNDRDRLSGLQKMTVSQRLLTMRSAFESAMGANAGEHKDEPSASPTAFRNVAASTD